MVALPPITAGSTAPGFVRASVAVQASSASAPASRPAASPVAAPAVSIELGGGAASSAIASQVRRDLINGSRALAAGGEASSAVSRPPVTLPDPPYTQNVGLYDNSTRVFVDIVLSGDQGKRVARVFGTPPPPKPKSEPVNIIA